MISYTRFKADELTLEHYSCWSRLQQANPALCSPYFCPEFTQAVSRVRDDVRVVVMQESDKIIGFFPFQQSGIGAARPVGGRLSDFHGVIAASGTSFNANDLIRATGASSWSFDHLIAEQSPFQESHWLTAASPFLDLSLGFETYKQERSKSGSGEVKHTLRKARKIQREVGPLRLEFHTEDSEAFENLLKWKSQQYHSTQVTDVFSYNWTVDLLKTILGFRDKSFRGIMSALYVGERLAAVHYGMQSNGVLHSWFPAFDREFFKYSPGLILLLELAKKSEQYDIHRIDLGKGNEQYKKSFMSGETEVAEGLVDNKLLRKFVKKNWYHARDWVKSSPLRGPAEIPLRMARPVREWLQFR